MLVITNLLHTMFGCLTPTVALSQIYQDRFKTKENSFISISKEYFSKNSYIPVNRGLLHSQLCSWSECQNPSVQQQFCLGWLSYQISQLLPPFLSMFVHILPSPDLYHVPIMLFVNCKKLTNIPFSSILITLQVIK